MWPSCRVYPSPPRRIQGPRRSCLPREDRASLFPRSVDTAITPKNTDWQIYMCVCIRMTQLLVIHHAWVHSRFTQARRARTSETQIKSSKNIMFVIQLRTVIALKTTDMQRCLHYRYILGCSTPCHSLRMEGCTQSTRRHGTQIESSTAHATGSIVILHTIPQQNP